MVFDGLNFLDFPGASRLEFRAPGLSLELQASFQELDPEPESGFPLPLNPRPEASQNRSGIGRPARGNALINPYDPKPFGEQAPE